MQDREMVDILVITNLPSFYKINLYNGIAKYRSITVIYTGDGGQDRNKDFFKGQMNFKSIFLSSNKIWRLFRLLKILTTTKYKELQIGGWDAMPLWLAAFVSPKRKNAAVIESSYLESATVGVKGLIKRLFISRISKVYASGVSQRKVTDNLGFDGRTVITKGVGVFNVVPQPKYEPRESVGKFVYVGRLTAVKNLELLISVFNKLPHLSLTIVGFGEQEVLLRDMAGENIYFTGAVDNKLLPNLYREHDVFILPSRSEPWGLVVEEALNNGLPVLVSDRVGCAEEIVRVGENGYIFTYNSEQSLMEAISNMCDVETYNNMRFNISKMDFDRIEQQQIECYF
ncbi:MAG: glycosyltransferase family 4 protein [Alistipes sp.]|nr:glycosyltransferase family 4 protein [Alistipes sp.]